MNTHNGMSLRSIIEIAEQITEVSGNAKMMVQSILDELDEKSEFFKGISAKGADYCFKTTDQIDDIINGIGVGLRKLNVDESKLKIFVNKYLDIRNALFLRIKRTGKNS